MKTWWAIAFGVAGGLLGGGVLALIVSPPRGEPVILAPPPTPAPLKVHVSGAVIDPGVYSLPAGSRVEDALRAAGGPLPEAMLLVVNLAARLQDGEQVHLPLPGPTPTPAGVLAPGSAARLASPPSGLVDINTASQTELESLPGIGPVTAERIIAYRQEHGLFATPTDIQKVPGIGPATFERLRELITTGSAP